MTSSVSAAHIQVLSAGAPKGGVAACAEAFSRDTAHEVVYRFATAPVLRAQVEKGEAEADIVIAPVPSMEVFEKDGRVVAGTTVVIGSVQAGVAVRDGVPDPDISTPETFRAAILGAKSLVCNEASSGIYIIELMERLGIATEAAAKMTRLPSGSAVLQHLSESAVADEIGFGQIPEIRRFADKGVRLVGPLPQEIGKVTTYAAGLLSDASAPEAGADFVQFLATPAAKRIFVENGVT
jgi:molybdate transport system substrate-binding protein